MTAAHRTRRAPALLFGLATLLAACAARDGASPGDVPEDPPGSTDMTERPFGLEDEQFWSDPWATLETVADARREARASGLLIDTPDAVDLGAHGDVPVLALCAGTNREFAEAPFETSAVLTAVDPERNQLWAGMALSPDVEPELPPGFADEPGFSVENHELALAVATSAPMRPGRLLVTAFLRDRSSNRRLVRLARGARSYDDPAVGEFLAEQMEKAPPRAVFPEPGTPGTSYRRQPASPATPERGIALAAERVIVARDGMQVVLRGAFRLPVRTCDLVRPIGGVVPDVGCEDARAVVPIHLLVIGSDDPGPQVVSLGVPVFEPPEPVGDEVLASGVFALDLARLPSFDGTPQTWFVRALSGLELSAPLPVAIVAEESLPGR